MDVTEQDVHLQTEETDGSRFATPEEIRELADQGIFLHYDSTVSYTHLDVYKRQANDRTGPTCH